VSTSARCKIPRRRLSPPEIPFCDVRGCSFLFVAANGKLSRPHIRFRAGFVRGGSGSCNVANSAQITESKTKNVAQEKKANGKENANPGKEKESKGVLRKKEIKSIADSVTKEVAISDAGSIGGGTDDPNADTNNHGDTGSHRSASNFAELYSASRGREVWISRRSRLRTAAKPYAAPWLVALVSAGSCLPVSFAVCPQRN